jgi:hypothetical protein
MGGVKKIFHQDPNPSSMALYSGTKILMEQVHENLV